VRRRTNDLAQTMSWIRLTLQLAWRAVLHPSDGVALLTVAWRFRSRRWYTRFPFLPLPATDYVQWRMHTAYGDHHAVPPADDVLRYARWARRN
jgi:hypothetical protein